MECNARRASHRRKCADAHKLVQKPAAPMARRSEASASSGGGGGGGTPSHSLNLASRADETASSRAGWKHSAVTSAAWGYTERGARSLIMR